MVQFNELRITPEDQRLIIDVSVKDLSYYDNVYIDTIIVDNQETYISTDPSTTPVYAYEDGVSPEDVVVEKEDKRIRIELPNTLVPNLSNNLFFIYVTTKGTPSADTPCGMDNPTTIGVVFDLYRLQQLYMNYIREVESNDCIIPKEFIDQILRYKAFKLALVTGNYIQAIKYWKRFFANITLHKLVSKCPCRYV